MTLLELGIELQLLTEKKTSNDEQECLYNVEINDLNIQLTTLKGELNKLTLTNNNKYNKFHNKLMSTKSIHIWQFSKNNNNNK